MDGRAVTIAAQVRTGRMRAIDVIESALAAAEDSHDTLNAFTLIDIAGARHRAEAIDKLVADGKDPGPLAGVPIGLKDIIDDAGMPNSRGSSFPTRIAEQSGEVVRRLGVAGAVIIGRTGLHEFAFGFTSENPWFGSVRNPWDTTTSAGGSSGGSGAAVAAGIVPIAVGTDTGGSVRVPAAMCGVLGLKVTHGRVPLTGVFPLVPSLDTVGPIARTVGDLSAAYLAMAGDDPSDPWSQPRDVVPPSRTNLSKLRLGIVRQWLAAPTDAWVRAGMDRLIALLTAAGVVIEDVDAPELAPIPELGRAIGPEILLIHDQRHRDHPERYGRDVAERVEQARTSTAADLMASEQWGSHARATIARLHESGITALVAPTVGAQQKVIGTDTVDVDGRTVFHREVLASFTAPVNRIRVPALAAPVAGSGHQGVSFQLVGAMWSEATLLSIAGALEEAQIIGVARPPEFLESGE
jgi:aspartyl-tRNA(Asn)/glutamyl-tRNA(Gln) amidotransferase subunit A